ncbi:MAG: hypothetical protein WBC96_03690 [Thermodesulfobacteriota bacterium]
MLGYVGSVKSFEITDKEALHSYVYSEAKNSIPTEKLNALLGGGGVPSKEEIGKPISQIPKASSDYYQKVMSTDPEAFYQQLPFYQIRVIYIALVYLVSELGVNIFLATNLISTISLILGLWILLFAFKPYINNYLLYSIPFFFLAFGLIEVAKLGTPDGLAFLMVTIIAYLFTRIHWSILIIIPISILVRTDLIIYAVLILGYLLIYYKAWRYLTIASILSSALIYYLVNQYFGNYGWMTVFYFSFIEPITHPADFTIQISLIEFLKSYKVGIVSMLFNPPFLVYIAITILSLFLLAKSQGRNLYEKRTFNLMRYISLSSFLYIAIHFLLYPSIWNRFFIGQYMLGLAILLYLMSNEYLAIKSPTKQ